MSITSGLPNSIIEGIRDYLSSYDEISGETPIWVQYLGTDPGQFSISPLPGDRTIDEYIDGTKLMVYPFAIESVENADDDPERADTNQFYESLADWLEEQTLARNLPDLPSGKTAEEIKASTWGYLNEFGESGTETYLIQCELIYKQST